MSAERTELAALVADLRGLLEAEVARGVRAVAADSPASEGAVDARPTPSPAAVVTAEAMPEPASLPEARPAWADLASALRSSRTPLHHEGPRGAAGLAAIREDLGDCRRCRLCEGRTRLVFGAGDPDAELMVIGEGPGEQEDLRGEPFVGPAGAMLDKMLENVVGLGRSQVYVANVVKCRPPGNRKPQSDETEVCKAFLFRQIAAVRPKLLLVLGGTALEAVLNTTGITKARGTEGSFSGIAGIPPIPAIATFHPAYLLRQPADKRLVFEDLKLVRARFTALGGRVGTP